MLGRSLTELANLYGSDKGTVGPSRPWGAHNYTDVYEAYLHGYRDSAIALLEIGLGVVGDRWDAQIVHGRNTGGASVKMWHDFFPRGRIFGIDVNPCPYLDNDRIRTFVADQGSVQDLGAFVEATGGLEFDVIIDDGSHRPDHQQISLDFFFKRLKRGGLYFVEDLAPNGAGDGARGRHACNAVLNTRRVLKHFREHGTFPMPHAFTDPAYLGEHVAYLGFHVPECSLDRTFLFRRVLCYKPDTESLCAIRKR